MLRDGGGLNNFSVILEPDPELGASAIQGDQALVDTGKGGMVDSGEGNGVASGDTGKKKTKKKRKRNKSSRS